MLIRWLPRLLCIASLGSFAHAQTEEVLILVAFGDSTTAQRESVEHVWPARLAERLGAGGLPTFVVNSGRPGNTTAHARRRFERDVLLRSPNLAVIQFGINDATIDVQQGRTVPRVALADYEANLRFMVAELKACDVPTILMTPNPLRWTSANRELWGSEPYDAEDPRGLNLWNARYAEAVRMIAADEGVPLVDVYRLFDERGVEGCAALLEDGIHPNDAGQALIAVALSKETAALRSKLRLQDAEPASGHLRVGQGYRQECVSGQAVHDAWPRRGASVSADLSEPQTRFANHWSRGSGFLRVAGESNDLWSTRGIGPGDFRVSASVTVEEITGTAAAFEIGAGCYFGFDSAGGGGGRLFLNGWLFGAGVRLLGPAVERLTPHVYFSFRVERRGSFIRFMIDDQEVHRVAYTGGFDRVGFVPLRGAFKIRSFSVQQSDGPGKAVELPLAPDHGLPVIDLTADASRQVVVDREPEQYLGHPTTVLLEDDRTMICVYPKGHGKGGIVMKRSTDGGLTWSERLPVPKSWATSREVPTIHRVVDAEGKKRLILWSGLYPARLSVSEDDGVTWSELEPVGDWGGIVVMGAVTATKTPGEYLAFFHDDGRFFDGSGQWTSFDVYQTRSADGGLNWSEPVSIAAHPHAHLCEPGVVRSPDGSTLALLLRENSRTFNSFVVFSTDEGATWSTPRQLPAALTGDRHTARYAPDGRLFVTFRDTTRISETQGDWVAWVGTWEDIANGTEGQYRVRLMDNHHRWDCAYPGLELLPDGTFVTTTYGHWTEGEPPYIVSVRLRLEELDALLETRTR